MKRREQKIEGMVFIKGGCFDMGDTFGDGNPDERPVHNVCVDDFYMGETEVTYAEWKGIMGDNPLFFKGCNDCPVDRGTWNDAQEFINKLNQKTTPSIPLNKGGQRGIYRLPTEAEWEYAARSGGKNYKYSWGNGVPSGNIADEAAKRQFSSGWTIWSGYDDGYAYTAPVGTFKPNDLGLYDMTGNVWEWTADWYDENYYKNSPKDNPKGPSSGKYRVPRGGSWNSAPTDMHTTHRAWADPTFRNLINGFRLALSSQ